MRNERDGFLIRPIVDFRRFQFGYEVGEMEILRGEAVKGHGLRATIAGAADSLIFTRKTASTISKTWRATESNSPQISQFFQKRFLINFTRLISACFIGGTLDIVLEFRFN